MASALYQTDAVFFGELLKSYVQSDKSPEAKVYLPYRRIPDPVINETSKFKNERNEQMKHTVKHDIDTAEARDALRLEAVPVVMALEVAQQVDGHQPEELISHYELAEAIRDQLGLELAESEATLDDYINSYMVGWNWLWVTYNSGLEQFYARPQGHRAEHLGLLKSRRILQAGHHFPDGYGDIMAELWDSEYAGPFKEKGESDWLSGPSKLVSDQTLVDAFMEAHLMPHLSFEGLE